MSKNNQSVCIVIPAFNEATVIGEVIDKIKNTFNKSIYDYDIVVVNDGSRDDTGAIATEKGVIVIDHILNSGAGSATATGLSYAQQNNYDMAATMDGDNQHNPGDVLNGFNRMRKTDVDLLIGSRLIDSEGMSSIKVLGNKGLSAITYLLFGINVTDSQSGLRIFSKESLVKLKWKTSGYEFCSEMLWRAKQQKLNIEEFPVEAIYTDYSKAKGQNNWNAFRIVNSLIKQRLVEIFGE